MGSNPNLFYITFEYDNCKRISEKDNTLEKYLREKIKKVKLEKYTENDGGTNCGIAVRLTGNIREIERFAKRIGSKFDYITSVKIRYPRTFVDK